MNIVFANNPANVTVTLQDWLIGDDTTYSFTVHVVQVKVEDAPNGSFKAGSVGSFQAGTKLTAGPQSSPIAVVGATVNGYAGQRVIQQPINSQSAATPALAWK